MKEECHSDMPHDYMNIYHLIVHIQQVEDTMSKRERSFYCGSSKGTLDMQEKPWFKKRSSNQLLTEYTKARNDSVFSPMSQKERATSSQNKKPTC